MKKLDMIVIGPGPAPPTAVIRRKSLCQQLNLKKKSSFCRPMRFGENILLPMFKKDGKVVKHSQTFLVRGYLSNSLQNYHKNFIFKGEQNVQ